MVLFKLCVFNYLENSPCIISESLYTPLDHSVSSVTQSCPTLCNPMNRSTPGLPVHHHPARQASLSITISQSSLRLMSIESMMPSSHLILCCPLPLLPPIPPSIRVFSNESALHIRWPKHIKIQKRKFYQQLHLPEISPMIIFEFVS